MLTLRFPTSDDKEQIIKACNDPWAIEWGMVHYWESICHEDPDKLIKFLPEMSQGINLKPGHVTCTFLFAFNDKNEIIGRTSIRHELNDHLLHEAGHIGYGILPEFRLRGYATEILKQSMEYCKNELGLDRVLVTCDDDNIGSYKTIEKNGGVLENKVIRKEDGKTLCRRYWIDL